MSLTYTDMVDARDEYSEARMKFSMKYHEFLSTVLKEAGFHDKIVQIKESGMRGQFMISGNASTRQPFEIKFYPLTKNEEVSMKSRFLYDFYPWREDNLAEQLLRIAEVVSDS